ncbi:Pol [Symbiodinium sp. CCMP2456]|nr:Pol [Symbiodinium sp. CCMP2456]
MVDKLPPPERRQLICVQETHWGATVAPTFVTAQWTVYTSPTTDNKSAGLAVLVHKDLLKHAQVAFADPQPGRIQHIRIIHQQWTADVLHVYQKPHNSHPSAAKDSKTLRAEIWHALHEQLRRVPRRSTLMLLGDFNCPLPSSPHAALAPDLAPPRRTSPGYNMSLRPITLFISIPGSSLIDHVLMRVEQTDNRAKQARPKPLGLAEWRLGGKHIPVFASLPLIRFTRLNKPPVVRRTWDHWAVVQLSRNPTDPRWAELCRYVQDRIHTADNLLSLNQLLVQCATELFPAPARTQRLALWQTTAMHGGIKSLWERYRRWKLLARTPPFDPLRIARRLQEPAEQLQQLERHYRSLYAADSTPETAGLPRAAIRLDIDPAALARALATLSPHKATPPELASNALWRITSDVVAPVIAHWAKEGTSIPQLWRNAWLVLVPKIPRPLSPKNLRPIGLTESSGRAYARMLQVQLRPFAAEYLRGITQFAYLPHRDAAMAIQRVAAHCRYVEQKCSHATRTVADRQECLPAPAPSFVGIQLSLDLSSAFDLVRWPLLDRAMAEAGVPTALRHEVMSWYYQVCYTVEHLGKQTEITAQQGLRQGCQLAPTLWAMAVGWIYKHIWDSSSPDTMQPWLQANSTTYADDIHLKETATTTTGLDKALYRFGLVLDALAEQGMLINAGKSAFLLRHRGSFLKKWRRRHYLSTSEGDFLHFRTPGGTAYRIPLREQHTYHAMASHTALHRIQAANAAWQRLRRILCSPRQLQLTARISLWKSTVLPTLLYGLAAVRLGPRDIGRVQALVIKHTRAMAHSYAHLQQESTMNVHHRLQVPTALDSLTREATALHKRMCLLQDHSDFVQAPEIEDVREQAAMLQAKREMQWNAPAEPEAGLLPHTCVECGQSFASFRLLRSHEAKKHGQRTPQCDTQPFDRFAHGTGGLPTCRHCGHRFRQWDNLIKRIKKNRCKVLRDKPPSVSAPEPATAAPVAPPRPTAPNLRQETAQDPLPSDSAEPGLCAEAARLPATVVPPCCPQAVYEEQPPPCTPTMPLCAWPEVQDALDKGRWFDLPLNQQVQTYLAYHCPICVQWAATPGGLKCHLTAVHPNWKALQTEVRNNNMTGAEMDLDEQEKLFFGQMGPLKRDQTAPARDQTSQVLGKRQRLEHQDSSKGRSKGKGKGKTNSPLPQGVYPSARMWAYSSGFDDDQDQPWVPDRASRSTSLEGRVEKLTQLALRQEQVIATGNDGMIPVLCQAADKWRTIREETPDKLNYSLKLTMFKQLLISLQERLTETAKSQQAMEHARSLGWLDSDQCWKVLKWNPAQQVLEVENALRAVSTTDLLAQIVQFRKATTEETLLRFKSIRPLSTEVTTDWVQFQIVVSLRMDGAPLWSTLQQWIGQSAWHTLGLSYMGQGNRCWPRTSSTCYALPSVDPVYRFRFCNTGLEASWEARLDTPHGVHKQDGGALISPLIMALPAGGTLNLQGVIDQWHSQAAPHALTNAPTYLCIQLQRFTGDSSGLQRDTRPLQGHRTPVRLPCFDADTNIQCSWAQYQVVAAQLHFGDSPDAGHYRTVLYGQKKFGHLRAWVTDDNIAAQLASDDYAPSSYLLWLRQVQDE